MRGEKLTRKGAQTLVDFFAAASFRDGVLVRLGLLEEREHDFE